MDLRSCGKCGSTDFLEKDGMMVCCYCRTNYSKPKGRADSTIELDDDVRRLLDKCKKEPKKARKYANLILDIDPGNKEALKYLR